MMAMTITQTEISSRGKPAAIGVSTTGTGDHLDGMAMQTSPPPIANEHPLGLDNNYILTSRAQINFLIALMRVLIYLIAR